MKISCPRCSLPAQNPPIAGHIIRAGYFYRSSDKTYVRRWRCRTCGKYFSAATSDPCFGQKKRQLNPSIFEGLSSTNSQRRLAVTLGCNLKTVARKLLFLGGQAEIELNQMNRARDLTRKIQFDEMLSHEHTRMKPLSIALAVTEERFIVSFEVASMPCNGLLAEKSRAKYGPRKDERAEAQNKMFMSLLPFVSADAEFKSDQNPYYPAALKKVFPFAKHVTVKGRRARHNGQGELKTGGFDPIFAFNHTAAMYRANVNRFIRKTWCTTKKQDRLHKHMLIYAVYHNRTIQKKLDKEAQKRADAKIK